MLQQDFNKVYTDIENCIITKPPYLNWRVPQTFYFDKRGWFEVFENLWYDRIYDVISNSDWEYYLWSIWSDIVLKKWTTTLLSTTKAEDKNFKFIYWTSCKWVSVENWTWLVSNITDPLNIYLEDSTKSWTVNAYAGMFVYIYNATAWTWQVLNIVSNTDTKLYISWIEADITWGEYKIFNSLWSIPFFLWWDALYWIHDDNEIIKVENFSWINDIVFAHNRFFSSDSNWNINKWWIGNYSLYQDWTSNVTTISSLYSMASFQDYLLLLSSDSISLIKKENITIWWETTEEFTWSLVTRDFWLFSMWAFEIYNQWLYILNSSKKFISLSINSVSDNKFTTKVSDEWIYIQQYLDNIWSWSSVNVYIDSNEIKIINTWAGSTDIYIFDRYYKWWHRWSSSIEIFWYYNVIDKYFWADLYNIWTSDYDINTVEFKQKIKLIFWEESFTAFKNIKFQKLILWTNTTEWIIMNYIITSWQDLIRFPKEIKWTKLLQQGSVWNASKGSMLGQTILGLWLIWQDDATLDYLYPKVWAVKINLGYACEMLEWELVATSWQRIVYWWQMIGYEQAQPWLTSVKNII